MTFASPKTFEDEGFPIFWIVTALRERGIPDVEICNRLDVTKEQLTLTDASAPLEKYLRLFEWAAEELGDPALGLNIAEKIRLRAFGLLGYLADNSANVRDLCLLASHYHEIFTGYFGFEFSQSGGLCMFQYNEEVIAGSETQQDIDFSLGIFVATIRHKTQKDWYPRSCRFTYSRPDDLSIHRTVFGTDLKFSQPVNQLIFDRSVLGRELQDSDPGLLSILRQQADALQAESRDRQSLSRTIHLMLSSKLGNHELSADHIADELNMSVRQLHRVLGRENASFRVLRRDVIQSTAREALQFTDASVSEIAEQLGYSEISAFNRAFKREEGISPLQYRKRTIE